MAKLFTPVQFRSITLRNRITVSPMCQYSAEDGVANDWHLVHLGSRAVGGAGLVIVEATGVSPEARITPNDLGIWNEAQQHALSRITSFVKQQGAAIGIQLAHAGRKASCAQPWKGGKQLSMDEGGWETAAPSAIPFYASDRAPQALDMQGIQKVITDFREAAKRALAAGFDLVEIHAAHGYLLHEFLSPFSNQRTDAYGGSFENRIRLLLEIVKEVRAIWPDHLPLFVRISASDWTEGGWDIEQSVELAKQLKKLGVDLVDCSSGGNLSSVKIPLVPGYQVPFAERIRKEADMATGAVGLITTAEQAEHILQEEKADIVLFARELLRDPYFPLHAATELGYDLAWPEQYQRAKPQ
jgi:2,4-dienoyl-CoA reductase-like NADH-dependent reductase (Old Yellow Enzyme family)